jgi:hypothetical protein
MIQTLKWKGEVTFEGSMEQFQSFKAAIEKHPVVVTLPESGESISKPGPRTPIIMRGGTAGLPFRDVTFSHDLKKMVEGQPRMQFTSIKGIAGGIRTPHLHLGDEVVLVDKEHFKTILEEAARNVFE